MLGKVRRTTRTDVGLSISMIGVAYLVWALCTALAKGLANELSLEVYAYQIRLPVVATWLCNSFIYGSLVWDVLGILWLVLGLALIVGASRQSWSISWAWLSGICQVMAAALLACWAAVCAISPYHPLITFADPVPYPSTGWTSLSIAVALALVVWTTVLVWLLIERARLGRGPSLRDSLRTHRS